MSRRSRMVLTKSISLATAAEKLVARKLEDVDGIKRMSLVVDASFTADKSTRTQREFLRRLQLCCMLYTKLLIEAGWGRERIFGHMPYFLRCELDGQKWAPPQKGIWVPAAWADPLSKKENQHG